MGVGSVRAAVENPGLSGTFRIRDIAPTVPIYSNIGAVQLNMGMGIEECRRAVEPGGSGWLNSPPERAAGSVPA